jgi:lysozyme
MQAGKVIRVAAAGLSISAAGWLGIVNSEWYTRDAIVPTKNDRPTYGLGSTFKEDGSPVKLGDKIEPVPAIRLSINHIAKDEAKLKQCVTGYLSQAEYDILVDFSYQYGVAATCNSSMVRHINAGRYRESCNAYTLYKFSGGYDCSTMIAGKPNKRCWGVWERSQERHKKCMEAQER